ncbi:MAG: peptidase M14 [Planctomycetes bacterium]|nr:peptidase M14 [Planctomycetota bacterium]MBL7038344.1 peptidase M14 [Pirellulaceae bacterium]
MKRTRTITAVIVLAACVNASAAEEEGKADGSTPPNPLIYINTTFENASPLFWEIGDSGEVNVFLVYDHERSSPNRAAGHWHFCVEAPKGSELTIVLNNFLNIYNGRKGSPAKDTTISYVSADGKNWRASETELLEDHRLKLTLHMEADKMYVARLEPYRLSDLQKLLDEIRGNPHIAIAKIGETVEGRPLEMLRVGSHDAPHRVLIRARAHPWEPGGNWVVQGMIRRLLKDDKKARAYRDRYSVHIMPMANKDGVARGWTRFNVAGKDLNRNWDQPADPAFAPENRVLETWIESMITEGRKPDLMIDFHNDQGGRLHISRPNVNLEPYLARMSRFESLLREHTWFTEGATGGNYRTLGSIGEGLLERYGIHACIHELNANWIAGLDAYPSGKNWELYGEQLCEVFYELFDAL